jgi:hypothetical protein
MSCFSFLQASRSRYSFFFFRATKNKSLTIATRVSAQMLNIWTALGFREQANSAKPQNGGEDDEL